MPSNHKANNSPNLYKRGANNSPIRRAGDNSPGLVNSMTKIQKAGLKENLDLEVVKTE